MVALLAAVTEMIWALLALVGASPGAETRIVLGGLTAERPPLVAHTVEEGETLDDLATLYSTSVPTLLALNPSTTAAPGAVLAVPAPGPAPVTLACGDLLAPLDKQHALPPDCEPEELEELPAGVSYLPDQQMAHRARDALLELLAAAGNATGETVLVRSSYRNYQQQAETFQYWVNQLGLERALATSAQAGHSEHQLGTTADLTSAEVSYELDEAFGATAAGTWLADHGWEYGFIVSYPSGMEGITGYDYEPWHVRWIGKEAAASVHASGLTLHSWLLENWKPGRYRLPNP